MEKFKLAKKSVRLKKKWANILRPNDEYGAEYIIELNSGQELHVLVSDIYQDKPQVNICLFDK